MSFLDVLKATFGSVIEGGPIFNQKYAIKI
jgi:hypothetical protein